MQISILGTDGAFLANNGSNAISILGPDGNLLPNDGSNFICVTGSDGAYQANDGTVEAFSILGTDGALKPYEADNSYSVLDENGALAIPITDNLISTLLWGGAQGAWYDPSDLSTMFLAASGAQTPVTATGSVVGLMLDKSKGLARGANLSINGDFSSNGSGWNVTGNDGTHVITWNNPGVRYQSDTTSPILTVSRPAVLTAGVWYEVDVTISGYTSGSIKLTTGSGVEPSIPASIGTHRVYVPGLTGGTHLGFLRNSSNTDLVVSSIVARPIAGNHTYQLTAASRPIFRDVGGLRYLEFDGVDDFLRATFTIAQPIDRVSALQQASWTNGDQIFGGVSANAGVLYQSTVNGMLKIYDGTAVADNLDLLVDANGVMTERHNGAASRLAINSGTYTTGNSGAGVPGGITIGASNTPHAWAESYIYQLIMRGSTTAMTDAQIAACRALCAAKSGVTL